MNEDRKKAMEEHRAEAEAAKQKALERAAKVRQEAEARKAETEASQLDMEEQLAKAQAEQAEAEKKINEIFASAGRALKQKMAQDPELRKLAYMMLFSNRLFNWAASEVTSIKGITNEMLQILVRSQREKAADAFDFAAMIGDFQNKQMPWLESRRREAVARRATREKRLRQMIQRVRKKNIDLPFHSMEALFDCNFSHTNMLVVVGERRAVAPVLRLCAHRYTKSGGHVALLASENMEPPHDHIAEHVLPPQIWRNSATIYGDLKVLLEPLSKGMNPMGMLVVEDLDNMLMMEPVARSRISYLQKSKALLEQYQVDYGGAMILGVCTDNDPLGVDLIQMYPPDILARHVYVKWQEPKVSDIPSILIGNDLMLLNEIEKELRAPV